MQIYEFRLNICDYGDYVCYNFVISTNKHAHTQMHTLIESIVHFYRSTFKIIPKNLHTDEPNIR